jgi:hypothetical protein
MCAGNELTLDTLTRAVADQQIAALLDVGNTQLVHDALEIGPVRWN